MNQVAVNVHPDNLRANTLLERCRLGGEKSPLEAVPDVLWLTGADGDGYEILWAPSDRRKKGERAAILLEDDPCPTWKRTLMLWVERSGMSPVEKGLALNFLLEQGIDRNEVLVVMDEVLGLPRSDVWLDVYAGLPDYPKSIRRAIHDGAADPRHVRYAEDMPDEFRTAFLDALGNGVVSPSVQETREWMEMTRRLESADVTEFTDRLQSRIDQERGEDDGGFEDQFLRDLRETAYPRTTERMANFRRELERIDLNGRINVSPPNNFEGDYLDFRIRCHRDDSLESIAEELKSCHTLLDYV